MQHTGHGTQSALWNSDLPVEPVKFKLSAETFFFLMSLSPGSRRLSPFLCPLSHYRIWHTMAVIATVILVGLAATYLFLQFLLRLT